MSANADTLSSSITPWMPTNKTHLLHLLIALILIVASPWMSTPVEFIAMALTAASALSIPLESWKPKWGVALGVGALWVAYAIPSFPGAVPFMTVYLACGLGIAHLGNRWVCYLGMLAAPLFSIIYSNQILLDFGFSSMMALPCVLLGEILRHQREEIYRIHQDRQFQLEQQRHLIAAELHDTLARDLTHAVMEAQQLKISHSKDQELAEELDSIIIPMRKAVAHIRQGLLAFDNTDQTQSLAVLATSPPEALSSVISRTDELLHKRGGHLQVTGLEYFTPERLGPGLFQQTNRILNEILTNAGKYAADAATVTMEMEADKDSFDCICTNQFSPRSHREAAESSGIGLVNARARAQSLSGQLSVSQAHDRWNAVLSIPLQIPPTESIS